MGQWPRTGSRVAVSGEITAGLLIETMQTDSTNAYERAEVTLPEEIRNVSASSILLSGPPMTHKFSLMIEMLLSISNRSTVITTKHLGKDVVSAYDAATKGDRSGTISVVDAVKNSEGDRTDEDRYRITYVDSPGNLTQIGVEFSKALDTMPQSSERLGIGIHSLSPLIVHSGIRPVYRFLEALTARIRQDEYQGVVVLDNSVLDHDVESLRHHFDAAVETRLADSGETELRITGHRNVAAEWFSY